jgi:hypothetical protein
MRKCAVCRVKTPEMGFQNKTICIKCWDKYRHQEKAWKQQLIDTGYSNGIRMINPLLTLTQGVEERLSRLSRALAFAIQKDGYREPPHEFINQMNEFSKLYLPSGFFYPASTMTFCVIMMRDNLTLPSCAYCGISVADWDIRMDSLTKVEKYSNGSEIFLSAFPNWTNKLRQHTNDHIIPPARNGSPSDFRNLTISCSECNSAKGQLTGYEFIQLQLSQGKAVIINKSDTEYMLYVQGLYRVTPPKLKRDFTKLRLAKLLM